MAKTKKIESKNKSKNGLEINATSKNSGTNNNKLSSKKKEEKAMKKATKSTKKSVKTTTVKGKGKAMKKAKTTAKKATTKKTVKAVKKEKIMKKIVNPAIKEENELKAALANFGDYVINKVSLGHAHGHGDKLKTTSKIVGATSTIAIGAAVGGPVGAAISSGYVTVAEGITHKDAVKKMAKIIKDKAINYIKSGNYKRALDKIISAMKTTAWYAAGAVILVAGAGIVLTAYGAHLIIEAIKKLIGMCKTTWQWTKDGVVKLIKSEDKDTKTPKVNVIG